MSKTSEDLRDVIFRSIDDVRDGKITPHQARAVADLSKQLIDSGRLDLERARLLNADEVKATVLVSNGEPRKIEAHPSDGGDNGASLNQQILSEYDDGVKPTDIAKSLGLKIADVMRVINAKTPVIAKHSNTGFANDF